MPPKQATAELRLKDRAGSIFDQLMPIFATLAALLVGAIFLILLDANPITAYGALVQGAFGSFNAFAETLVKAIPLLLVGLGTCIAYRGSVTNIGGEGQMIIGAILSTWFGLTFTELPGWLAIIIAMLLGILGGMIWGGIPGILKAYFNVNEILSTVMMNAVAVQIMNYLVSAWLDGVRLELKHVDQHARPAPVFDLKHAARTPLSPPVNHPWRTYGKKLNGKPTAVIN